jgi:dipeptidyl aminopeptidase/acylaminoacyl peptidase
MYKFLYLFCLTIFYSTAISQSLQLEEIMKGDDFIGHQPSNHRWAFDNETALFSWNPNKGLTSETYYWRTGMENPMVLPKELKYLEDIPVDDQKEFDVVYYIKAGNLYSYHKLTQKTLKTYVTSERLSGLTRGINPDILYFKKEDNIFSFNVEEGSIIQLTNFKKGKKPTPPSNKSNFLSEQQEEMFLFVQEAKELKKWNEEKSKQNSVKTLPKEWYTEWNYSFVTPSPDGKYIVFGLSETIPNKPTRVEAFITEDGYTSSQNARAKVSIQNQYKTQLYCYDVQKDTVLMVDFSELSGIKDLPTYYEEYAGLKDQEKKMRNLRFFNPIFNKKGELAIVDVRSQDNKDRWLVQLDLENGKIIELERQHDEAWIGGPGIGGFRGTLGFLKDDKTIYYQSENTGYSHLYLMDITTKKNRALTNGKWEVRDVTLSNDGSSFYITTTTSHPGNRDFYKVDIASSKMTEILVKPGAHEVVLSPDESKILVRYSYKNQPWELFVGENKQNANLTKITNSLSPEYNSYKWRDPEVITFSAADGHKVNARIYHPVKKNKNKAAVVFVHGAGYLQNAHNHWSSYHREYMFHNLLADKGYTVLDIDYRGSDGYGRDVRTGIYRHMGGLDLSDHVDGRKYLIDKHGIDPSKIGIYGGSYGGFITLMALLTEPGKFKAGAALRSVTDWAHYNNGYTSNILNYPETDTIAYRKSSPIYFAENLQDKLVMLHGMVDDNVQFQDIVRLTQRFIELGKKDWDLAVYPVEAHGFVKSYSWVDEYRRIMELFDTELLKKDKK